jgi:hypothetical protein
MRSNRRRESAGCLQIGMCSLELINVRLSNGRHTNIINRRMHVNRTLHPWLPSPDRCQSGECHRRLFLHLSYTARLRRLAIAQMPTLAAIRNATRNRQTARSLTRPKRRLQVSAAPPAASSGAGHSRALISDVQLKTMRASRGPFRGIGICLQPS